MMKKLLIVVDMQNDFINGSLGTPQAEKIVPAEELIGTAEKVARMILEKAPIAIATAKSTIDMGFNLDMAAASQLEVEACAAPFSSEDRKEGMGAFLEKRAAKFSNK